MRTLLHPEDHVVGSRPAGCAIQMEWASASLQRRPDAPAPEGVLMRWGLIPFFARGQAGKYSTINATTERLGSGSVWRTCWSRGQRALMLAGGLYEWHLNEAAEKHPYFIQLPERPVFAFAALWDRSVRADGEAIESCAVITMPGNELMRKIHKTGAHPHRMPAILREEDYSAWLLGSKEHAFEVLQPYPANHMVAHRVSRRVNSPTNNDESLLTPVNTPIPRTPDLLDESAARPGN